MSQKARETYALALAVALALALAFAAAPTLMSSRSRRLLSFSGIFSCFSGADSEEGVGELVDDFQLAGLSLGHPVVDILQPL